MAVRSEFYRRTRTVDIPGITIPTIDGVDVTGNDLFEDPHLQDFSQGVVKAKKGMRKPLSVASLQQVSRYHGRSYEIKFEGIDPLVWEDEFGILYASLTTKGNNFTDIGIMESGTAPSEFALKGLQDSDCLVRILVASKALRAVGVEAENITRVIVPDKIPFGGKMLTQQELKREMLLRELNKPGVSPDLPQPAPSIIKSMLETAGVPVVNPKIVSFLKDTRFVITVRAMQVSERIEDLRNVKTNEEFRALMGKAFKFVNFREYLKSKKDDSYKPRHFDVSNDEDIESYFAIYLPSVLGEFLGKMHAAGIVHKFPHLGNISLVGSLYDLDSVEGEPLGLGDDPIDKHKTAEDVHRVFDELPNFFRREVFAKGFFKYIDGSFPEDPKDTSIHPFYMIFSYNLLREYFKHYHGDIDILRFGHAAHATLTMTVGTPEQWQLVEKYVGFMGLTYQLDKPQEEIIEEYKQYYAGHLEEEIQKIAESGEVPEDLLVFLASRVQDPTHPLGLNYFISQLVMRDLQDKNLFPEGQDNEQRNLIGKMWLGFREGVRLRESIREKNIASSLTLSAIQSIYDLRARLQKEADEENDEKLTSEPNQQESEV